MSGRTWVAADHHLGHANIIKFTNDKGELLRGAHFKTLEEHDETIIERHNALVDPGDRVYILGDVCINRHSLSKIGRLNGRLVLVKGNHDIFNLKDYLPYFDDIRSYVVHKRADGAEGKIILSHIPIHPESLGRWGCNLHGHLHQNQVMRTNAYKQEEIDPHYICVSLEHTDYAPIQLHEALKRSNV